MNSAAASAANVIINYEYVMYRKYAYVIVNKCFSLLSVTFAGLGKHASLLQNLYTTNP